MIPSSVRAARATRPARAPFVTHILVPVMTYSSPSRLARQVSALVSLPASVSESDRAPRTSPVARTGSQRACWSGVPLAARRLATMTWVLRIPERDIHPAASSSMIPM